MEGLGLGLWVEFCQTLLPRLQNLKLFQAPGTTLDLGALHACMPFEPIFGITCWDKLLNLKLTVSRMLLNDLFAPCHFLPCLLLLPSDQMV